jgi:hypothetical protein
MRNRNNIYIYNSTVTSLGMTFFSRKFRIIDVFLFVRIIIIPDPKAGTL